LKIRCDAVFLSSVLLTLSFLLLLPTQWRDAQSGIPFWHFGQAAREDRRLLDSMGPGFADSALLLGQCGLAGIAMILVAVVIVWKGYVKQVRWTWFVMFIIVWGWYFPLFMLQGLSYARGFDVIRWLYYSRSAWILAVMLIALILPVRSFFREEGGALPGE
jgi:hypothetical protein